MINAKKRFSAVKFSKRALPCFLLAGLVLFFLFDGHKFLSFSQFAKNYTSLKDFVDGQLQPLLVWGRLYPSCCPISAYCCIADTCRRSLIGLDRGGCDYMRCNHRRHDCLLLLDSAEWILQSALQILCQVESGFKVMPFLTFGPAPDPIAFLGCEYRTRPVRDAPEPLYAGNIHWHHPWNINLCLGCQKLW